MMAVTGEQQVVYATWAGTVANVLLTVAKVSVGFLSASQALLADAAHSASDIVLIEVRVAAMPADDEHPYGHGKAEHVASILVAFLLVLVGVQIGIGAALMEQVLDGAEADKFIKTVNKVPGVRRVDQLHARTHRRCVVTDIRVAVDPHLSIRRVTILANA